MKLRPRDKIMSVERLHECNETALPGGFETRVGEVKLI
jgi:hypothetical protein